MSISQSFAYNTGPQILGTFQNGDFSIGVPTTGFTNQPQYWNGPDEELGWIIAQPVPSGNQPNPVGSPAYLGFFRTDGFDDSAFLDLVETIAGQNFLTIDDALLWISVNGYATNYSPSLILEWDIRENASYPGSGSTIYDLTGNNLNGTITGSVPFTNGPIKYLTVNGSVSNYIYTADMNPYLNPPFVGTSQSYLMWIYPESDGIIYSEQGTLIPDSNWYDTQIQRDNNNRFLFSLWPNLAAVPTSQYSLNNWYMIAWSYDGFVFDVFVNGQKEGTASFVRQTPYNNGGGLPMYFNLGYPSATRLSPATSNCTYRLGAVRIYNKVLSSAEVLTLFNNSKAYYGL